MTSEKLGRLRNELYELLHDEIRKTMALGNQENAIGRREALHRARGREMNSRWVAQRLVQLGFVAAVGIAWYVVTARGNVSPLLLPPLGSVYHEFLALAETGSFWPDLGVTLYELVVAFLIAAVAGTVIGYCVSRSGYAIKVFDPLLRGNLRNSRDTSVSLIRSFFGNRTGVKDRHGRDHRLLSCRSQHNRRTSLR